MPFSEGIQRFPQGIRYFPIITRLDIIVIVLGNINLMTIHMYMYNALAEKTVHTEFVIICIIPVYKSMAVSCKGTLPAGLPIPPVTNGQSSEHRTVPGRSSSGHRTIFIHRPLIVRASTDHRTTVDLSSYDVLR